MRIFLPSLLSSVLSLAMLHASAGCKEVECGTGTIERAGACVPADETVSNAKCGPFTKLVGDVCVPTHGPTVCQAGTTLPEVGSDGVTTCVGTGTGTGGCGTPVACPNPTAGDKQTICGQLFDFETNAPFVASGATGAQCTPGATTGPCALGIRAFDAIAFGTNPGTATPLAVAETYIDDCGRYRLADISVPAGPFIGLGIDDANMAMQGPAGVTNTVGVATPKVAGTATKDFEGFIATKATTDGWTASGGPPLSGGIYAMVFRSTSTCTGNRAGVTVTRQGAPAPANDTYFPAAQTTRTTVDTTASSTGANGTVLVINASVAESLAYSGTAGLPAECRYSTHAGASLPNILFIQVARPINAAGMTCPL
jgi:hypothetical protein